MSPPDYMETKGEKQHLQSCLILSDDYSSWKYLVIYKMLPRLEYQLYGEDMWVLLADWH